MSKAPITASRPAAVVGGIPWSWAAGMKCVWISPLVDQPQMKNVPTRIQNVAEWEASRNTRIAVRAAPLPFSAPWAEGGATVLSSPVSGSPYGRRPTAAGDSASKARTNGISSSASAATSKAACRQPTFSVRLAITGRKTSCPVAEAAENAPIIRPRWRKNQRLATIAPNTSASAPVPSPTHKPHNA